MAESKTVLITGSRKGLGRALAEHYLAAGWFVVGCSRKECTWSHENYRHFLCDVADPAQVRALVVAAEKESGGLYALINNAGIASMNALLLTPTETARRIFETNTLGTFHLLQEVGKRMCKRKAGRIVNFSSIAAPLDLEGEAVYAASKAAVVSLTQVAAREFGSMGVTVNAVGPTAISTDLISGVPKEKLDRLREHQSIPREGSAADVAQVVDFFLDPASDFITGQVVYLGGIH